MNNFDPKAIHNYPKRKKVNFFRENKGERKSHFMQFQHKKKKINKLNIIKRNEPDRE